MSKVDVVCLGLIISCLLVVSCQRRADVPAVDVELNVSRFEKDFFSKDFENLGEKHRHLQDKYGTFYKHFIENITGIGMVNDPAITYALQAFLSDKYINEVYRDSQEKYKDELNEIRSELIDAFKHLKYFFPQMVIPKITTFVSGFQYSVAVTDSVLGIGLDMYLGRDYQNYPKAGFPYYKIVQMDRQYMVADAMKSWILTEFFSDEAKLPNDVLGHMIQYGKVMYLLNAVLPDVHDTIKTGYTSEQLGWCIRNEHNVWVHLVDNKLLFSADPQLISKLFNDAPFTSGFPKESAPKIGIWVGTRIVESFMKNNRETTLPDLMVRQSAQEVLNKSRYKPKK